MAEDDYEQRRRESNEYLNRRDDQSDFEEGLRRRSKGLNKAIQDKNESRLYWESGIVSSQSSDTSPYVSSASKESLEDRLLHKRQWILESLGRFLIPSELKREWAWRLDSLTESNCAVELENLGADIWNPSGAEDVDRDFASLEEDLTALREMWSRYITKYR
jgi:hypothetical protein